MLTDVEVAVKAAQAGASVVRAAYGKPLARFDKGAGDFATAADIEAERAILDVLRCERPGDAVIGEETGRTGESDRVWLVDPLCGTRNFAAQTRWSQSMWPCGTGLPRVPIRSRVRCSAQTAR